MNLIPAEQWADEPHQVDETTTGRQAAINQIRQIQANALRYAAEQVKQGHELEKLRLTYACLVEEANQLDPQSPTP